MRMSRPPVNATKKNPSTDASTTTTAIALQGMTFLRRNGRPERGDIGSAKYARI
jgi:hypothetical protein